ncbi:hypothetical protein Vadar_032903 [Vaccinium darrowii]|uniref:Uncharacterized protein n=1 Tax=Vaccinium darrowii TaxID=229202 RepID=A0ACB7Z0B1_9ERIC|nr:hypothetical protein Vadar_032903 [Vaccinium darrowii]
MAGNKPYYVVSVGRRPGVYETWASCSEQVIGFSGAIYEKHATWEEANSALRAYFESIAGRRPNIAEPNLEDRAPMLIPMEGCITNEGQRVRISTTCLKVTWFIIGAAMATLIQIVVRKFVSL